MFNCCKIAIITRIELLKTKVENHNKPVICCIEILQMV